jgi:alpha-N-arabinofuranosidase
VNRREFLTASIAGGVLLQQRLTLAAPVQGPLQASIDASTRGEPINPLIFGGYMEPATTQVWAEMLTDRKFANPIAEAPTTPQPGGFGRFPGQPFRPVGPAGTVAMDTARPFVGAHSPRVTLAGAEPRGIRQSGLRLGRGRAYEGRVYLAGESGANVVVRVVWGTGPGDAYTLKVPSLSAE